VLNSSTSSKLNVLLRQNSNTRLYNNRARWYDPATGRFISEDPIGFAAGDANLYRYCGNSPTNATDPSGMIIETPWDIASVIVGAASVVYDVAHIAVTGEGWADLGMDLFGLGVDIGAALLPGVPGGVSMANRALRTGYKAVDVGRKIDTGINAYQAVQSGINSYKAFSQGDILGGTLNLVGAGLGGTHFAIRTGSAISTSRWHSTVNVRSRLRAESSGSVIWDSTHPLIEGTLDSPRSAAHTFLQQAVAEEMQAMGVYQRVGTRMKLSEFSGLKHSPDIMPDNIGLTIDVLVQGSSGIFRIDFV